MVFIGIGDETRQRWVHTVVLCLVKAVETEARWGGVGHGASSAHRHGMVAGDGSSRCPALGRCSSYGDDGVAKAEQGTQVWCYHGVGRGHGVEAEGIGVVEGNGVTWEEDVAEQERRCRGARRRSRGSASRCIGAAAQGSVEEKADDEEQGDGDDAVVRLRHPWCPWHEGEAAWCGQHE